MVARRCSSRFGANFSWLLLAGTVAVSTILPARLVRATLHDTGQWSEYGQYWGGYAIHMAIGRGEGTPYHSYILWWSGSGNDFFEGREMGWSPTSDDCEEQPDSSTFFPIAVAAPGMNQFCAGHNWLADGRLLIAGGTDEVNSIDGDQAARVWQPGSSQSSANWVIANPMQQYRWYPTTTALADGKVLVLTGIHNQPHTVFGGRLDDAIPTQAVADSVRIFNSIPGGEWRPNVLPDSATNGSAPHRPAWREFHSAAGMGSYLYEDFRQNEVYFGGRDRNGQLLRDTWLLERDENQLGADFSYKWTKGPTDGAPTARSEHTAVGAREPDASMYVFGGLNEDDVALNDVRRLYHGDLGFAWETPTVSGTPPTVRYGHAAFYDEIPGPSSTTLRRMIVFGGAGSLGGAPTDMNVYEMRITGTHTVSWSVMDTVDLGYGHPSARLGHAMDVDGTPRTKAIAAVLGDTLSGHAAFLFGGQTGTHAFSKELWALWVFDNGKVGWQRMSPDSTDAPSARSHASLVIDGRQGTEEGNLHPPRVYIFGGDTSGVALDKYDYTVDPWSSDAAWSKWAQAGAKSTGHTSVLQQGPSNARVAEVYDPNSNTWTPHTSANLEQDAYAPTFLIPGGSTAAGRVFSMAVNYQINTTTEKKAYYVDVASGGSSSGWTAYSNGVLGFECEGMVMYRPGKIMAASGFGAPYADSSWIGRTKKFDTAAPSSGWQQAAYGSGEGSLTPRRFHNLVLLPDGKVLAVGGLRAFGQEDTAYAVRYPQIWDPEGADSMGAWSDSVGLARQPHKRNYHSTAVLLPDGRVLSAGGFGSDYPDAAYADVFCPPYLFSGDTLAVRPNLISATGRWRYGADVTFAIGGGSTSDTTIRRVCLIRAPSPTHGFDQSERYVPLTLLSSSVRGDGVRQYFLNAPADSFIAPPGDYMFFATSSSGVPCIAKWIRVGSTYNGQFDTTPPDSLWLGAEFVSSTKVYLDWIARGDDGNTGTALDYDIRYSTSPIDNSNFSSQSRLGNLPIPLLAGTVQAGDSVTVTYPCTYVYFAGKSRDRAENWSAISRKRIETSGPCRIDPGESMKRARDEGASSLQTQAAGTGLPRVGKFAVPASLGSASTLRLVATYLKGEVDRWTVSYEDLQGQTSLLAATGSQVLVQEPLASGGWNDRSILSISPGSLGVRSLLRNGRVVFPAGTTLQSIEAAPQSFLCTEATHSRLGNLLATGSPLDSVSLSSSTGDSLTLAFAPDTSSTAGEDHFFSVLVPGGSEASHARPQVRTTPGLPTSFALYSAHPNPFSRSTSIRFDLPRPANVRVEVFDIQGRRVTSLVNEVREAGRHSATWSGATTSGRAAAGVYVVRMRAGEFTAEKRISLLP